MGISTRLNGAAMRNVALIHARVGSFACCLLAGLASGCASRTSIKSADQSVDHSLAMPEQGLEAGESSFPNGTVPRTKKFGLLRFQEATQTQLDLGLSVASRCKRWPRTRAEKTILTPNDARVAGCRIEVFRGEINLYAQSKNQSKNRENDLKGYYFLGRIEVPEGKLRVSFAELFAMARASGVGAFDELEELIFGDEAWAGRIQLDALRGAWAQVHARAATQNWAAKSLFLHRYPDLDTDGKLAHAESLRQAKKGLKQAQTIKETGPSSWRQIAKTWWSPYFRLLEGFRPETRTEKEVKQ